MTESTSPGGVRGETRVQEPSPRQRTIARRAAEARATVPDLELTTEVEVSATSAVARERGWSTTAILVRACALALRRVPRANSAYRDGHFELYSRINVGIAVPTADAYLTPTVFDADRKSVEELTEEVEILMRRADSSQLSPPELSGATFTVTDLGAHRVVGGSTILSSPQAAGLVAGAIREIPIVRDGAVVAGKGLTLTLACDHRILYPHQAAGFLTIIKDLLEGGEP